MNGVIKDILNKLKKCDDFHDRCDCLLGHDEITYLLDYIQQKENIIKEVRETLINSKEYKMAKEMNLTSKMSILIELLEILDKDITKKSDYNYEKVEKENNNGI